VTIVGRASRSLPRRTNGYRDYLAGERQLAADTARGYVDMVRAFVISREDADRELDLWDLTAADVLGFVVAECPRRGRSSEPWSACWRSPACAS
jgi:hypothetical protein